MIKRKEFQSIQKRSAQMIRHAKILITEQEAAAIDVADFGLSNIEKEGVQILTYFATERISAKVLVLLPNQTEPEHWHPPVDDDPGKQEYIRAISGNLRFYLPGEGRFWCGYDLESFLDFLRRYWKVTFRSCFRHHEHGRKHRLLCHSFGFSLPERLDRFCDPIFYYRCNIEYHGYYYLASDET